MPMSNTMLTTIEKFTDPQANAIQAFASRTTGTSEQRSTRAMDDRRGSEEQELIASAKSGDSAAFAHLIQRYYSACMKRAMLILQNKGDAEDEIQNAFWKALLHLEQYRGEGSFPAWLARIVETQCLMHLKEKRTARFLYLDKSNDSDIQLELVGQTRDPEDQLGEAQVIKLVRSEISRMPPLLRKVILLRDMEGLPIPEVALRLGVSVPAAKSRLMRARIELRARIVRHCGRKGCGTLTQSPAMARLAYSRAR